MNEKELETERQRFNALSVEDAKVLLANAEGERPDLRSCWYCNGGHEHLKNREVLLCFACGMYYLKGYPAPAVAKRSKGEEVSREDMQHFNETLAKA